MRYTVSDPIGAVVTDLAVTDLDAGTVEQLRELLATHGVLALPAQAIDDAAFVAFLKRFGELTFTTGETAVEGQPDLNVVSNIGRATPPRSTFHVDTTYIRHPPIYTALRAVSIPEQGGETLFTNQYRAYETLAQDLRDALHGRTMTHVVTGLELGEDDEKAAEHPVFQRHPTSGRTALYMSTPSRCVAISNMPDEEARRTVADLFAHSTREENIHRHAWSPDDILVWDNRCVMHRADHSGVVGDRVMHRGMVAGDEAAAA
ncbi:MAG: TauD/TfdA family dioxygenase [Actinomycetota bacterium]|nr:TauD/TfdA family dioxygenase [Actinomycetota bacterium]